MATGVAVGTAVCVATGVAVGLAVRVAVGRAVCVATGVAVGTAVCVATGVAVGLAVRVAVANRSLRRDRRHGRRRRRRGAIGVRGIVGIIAVAIEAERTAFVVFPGKRGRRVAGIRGLGRMEDVRREVVRWLHVLADGREPGRIGVAMAAATDRFSGPPVMLPETGAVTARPARGGRVGTIGRARPTVALAPVTPEAGDRVEARRADGLVQVDGNAASR